ncbi:MAG: hypothetical protein JWP11_916 [Frankiales bacterium]|jgi:hypothetical protein|nr:hypothetical protein [Frankiales bacterium]
MARRVLTALALLTVCSFTSVAPALAAGPSSITVGPVTMGNPGCC